MMRRDTTFISIGANIYSHFIHGVEDLGDLLVGRDNEMDYHHLEDRPCG